MTGLTERMEKQLEFIAETDKLKSVKRQTLLINEDRAENDAEHSWHLVLSAMLLSEYSNEKVDLLKVIKMVTIHDIVEIDAGDTYCYDSEGIKTQEDRELKAADRLFGILPEDQKEELYLLWREFEEKKTPEAKFAAALDRVQPLLLNYLKGGVSWKSHGVAREQVEGRQEVTRQGSEKLYCCVMDMIRSAQEEGMLK